MKFLEKYSSRDQKVMLIGGVFLLVWVLYFFVLDPIMAERQELQKSVLENKKLNNYFQSVSGQLKAVSVTAGRSIQRTNSSVAVVLEASLIQGGLSKPQTINPEGNDKAMVRYDSVDFSQLMRTLDTMKNTYAITLETAKFNDLEKPGLVSATLNFDRKVR